MTNSRFKTITDEMVSNVEWTEGDLLALGGPPNQLVGDLVDKDGRIFYMDGDSDSVRDLHYRISDWGF